MKRREHAKEPRWFSGAEASGVAAKAVFASLTSAEKRTTQKKESEEEELQHLKMQPQRVQVQCAKADARAETCVAAATSNSIAASPATASQRHRMLLLHAAARPWRR